MERVIFYGAGKYAKKNIKYLKCLYSPLCFADADSNKWGECIDNVEITSIEFALEMYSDPHIVITTDSCIDEIFESLKARGIDENSIHFVNPREYRKGCDVLGKVMQLDGGVRLEPCCFPNSYKIDVNGKEFDEIFSLFQSTNKKIIDGLRNGERTSCSGCSELRFGWWEKDPKLVSVSLATGFREDRCNIRCVYCDAHELLKNTKKSRWTALEMITQIIECKTADVEHITLNDGEITFNPYANEILDLCMTKGWNLTILTNGIIFSSKIAEGLKTGRFNLLCSIDAGTKDTFKTVKGVDKFDTVYENLVNYGKYGNVMLKYIFLENINDQKKDVEGFIQLALDSNASVNISRDIYRRDKEMNAKEMEIVRYMIEKLRKSEVKYVISYDTLNLRDVDKIRELEEKR